MSASGGHFFAGAQPLMLFADAAHKQRFVQALVQPVHGSDAPSTLLSQIRALGEVGYVSRGHTLLSGFTVLENIGLPLLHRCATSMQEIIRRSRQLCRFAGIGPALLQRDAAELGVLEKIQACFLQAAVCEPQLLVFDTVFDLLPPADQHSVATLMRGYRDLYPLRCMLLLGYAAPPAHLFVPTSDIDGTRL